MELTLRIPTRANMPFRAAMLADPATMSYNAPWAPPHGCLPFPEAYWNDWLDCWVGHAPDRWAAYVFADGEPVGEVCWHSHGRDMGVVICAQHRGKGYGAAALRLLLREAFERQGLEALQVSFEPEREGAIRLYTGAGFVSLGEKEHILTMCLTRDAYFRLQYEHWLRDVYDAMCAYDQGVPERIHHFAKVHSFARQIGLHEHLDARAQFTLEVAALTHDIGIKHCIEQTGSCPGPLQEKLGPPEADAMLRALGLPGDVIVRVCFLIAHHHTTRDVDALDWRILLEADFLVNMIENSSTQEGIDAFRDHVFRTREGLHLIGLIRPAKG